MANHATARDPDPLAPNQAEQLVGRVLDGRYRIEAQLGEGGLGTVYRAQHLKLARQVAIKVLREEVRAIPQLRLRFEREARALSSLTHPNIITITDFGSEEGSPYLVMELALGRELAKLIGDPIAPKRALSIMRQILASLAYAHDRDVIHRDLKPSNVIVRELIDGRDHVTVLDFGLAKFVGDADSGADLTRSGLVVGTPAYMPPEQIASGAAKADARSDIYSAGLILFEMIAGRRPFVLTEPAELLRAHLVLPPPTLSEALGRTVNPELEDLIGRALTKSPDDRFQTAKEMIDAIDSLPPEPLIALTGSKAMPPRRVEPRTPIPFSAEVSGSAPPPTRRRRSYSTLLFLSLVGLSAAPIVYLLVSPNRVSDRSVPSGLDAEIEAPVGAVASAEPTESGGAESGVSESGGIESGQRTAETASPPAPSGESANPSGQPDLVIVDPDSQSATTPDENEGDEPSLVAAMTESLSELVADVLPSGLTTTPADDEAVEEAPAPASDEESEAEARIDALEEHPIGPEVVSAPEPDEPAPQRETTTRTRPAPRNLLRGNLAPLLRRVLARTSHGNDISNRLLQQLTYYRNDNPRDVRTRLVLGHVYMQRGWFTEAVTQFEHAANLDLSVRGDPDMLDSLIRAARTSTVFERAGNAIVWIYGREARSELGRAIERTPRDAEKRRLTRILQRVGG